MILEDENESENMNISDEDSIQEDKINRTLQKFMVNVSQYDSNADK